MCDKKALRREMRARRDALPAAYRQRASAAICRILEADPAMGEAHTVALYAPLGSEADLHALARAIRRRGGVTLYPRCMAEGRMEFYAVSGEDALLRGKWGIMEPDPTLCPMAEAGEIDRMLLPCVALDGAGNRLGYGGGYYDRYLAREGFRAATTAVAFGAQMTECIPTEPTDRKVDAWVTEDGLVRRKR